MCQACKDGSTKEKLDNMRYYINRIKDESIFQWKKKSIRKNKYLFMYKKNLHKLETKENNHFNVIRAIY